MVKIHCFERKRTVKKETIVFFCFLNLMKFNKLNKLNFFRQLHQLKLHFVPEELASITPPLFL